MTTDSERREVARRLRGFVTDDSVYADVDAVCVLHAIGLYYKDVDRLWFSGFDVTRLADLIEPSEPKVRCVAEVKVDGERLEELAHDAAVELTGIDRDALLALADECDSVHMHKVARRIREALGVEDFRPWMKACEKRNRERGRITDGEVVDE